MTQTTDNTELQIQLEETFHKKQALPRLRELYGHEDIVSHLEEQEIPTAFGVELLAQIMLHGSLPFTALVSMLEGQLDRSEDQSSAEHLQTVAETLERCVQAQLVLYVVTGNTPMIHVLHRVSDEILAQMDMWQYPLPMVSPPNQLKSNRDTGYLSKTVAHGSILLNHKDRGQDVCLDHLNRVNAIPLSLNLDTARLIGNHSDKLAAPRPGETQEDYLERVNAFHRFNREAGEVIDSIAMAGNQFWMTHAYDKRGRVYAQGYHVNPQGSDWSKHIIELSEKEVVSQ